MTETKHVLTIMIMVSDGARSNAKKEDQNPKATRKVGLMVFRDV
jgi:hypothetical protein